jgi:heptosyltransferase I
VSFEPSRIKSSPFQALGKDANLMRIAPESRVERLLVVRLGAMGDVIHTLPAVHALREAFPEALIGWLIEERWAELLCAPGFPRRGRRSALRPLVDEVHTVSLKTWGRSPFSLSTLQSAATMWNDVRGARYEVAIDLQGTVRSGILARLAGANIVFGAASARESPASLWYSRKIITRGAHVIQQNVSIAEAVIERFTGAPPDVSCDLPRDPQAETRIGQYLAERDLDDFAILNPGGGWGAKRWPAERYGEVGRKLAELGFRSILNYGPGEEELVRSAANASEGKVQAMRCTVSELIALTRRARLFIGGDTGPLHLAAALRVPVVAIFGPTNPARNGPYGTRSIVLRHPESVTSHKRHAAPENGLLEIGCDAVIAAARKLLNQATD